MNTQNLAVTKITPGNNDRTIFDLKALRELADNIQANGLIQPPTVRVMPDDTYQIVAGERRFRACTQILGWSEIPAFVAELTDEEAAAIMLSENTSRADLDPIDEGLAYASRMKAYGWSVAKCAEAAGVSSIRVQFRVKLLDLRLDLQQLIRTGNLPIGYAQVLADAKLDTNRQLIAIAHLRDNPNPSPAWFRRICNQLLKAQAQGELLEVMPIFSGEAIAQAHTYVTPEPPHPSTTKPTTKGHTPTERLTEQASFWSAAADAWEAIGKPFKRQECQAAARAIQLALETI